MTTLVFIQILLFVWFPIFIWIREGVLSSISASTYRLQGNQKGIFTLWLVLLALSMLGLIAMDVMPVWAGLMAIGFTLTGMSPEHRTNPNSLEDAFHTAGTILTIAAGFGGLYFSYEIWIHAVIFALPTAVALILKKKGKFDTAIWWIECWAMATIAMGLLSI